MSRENLADILIGLGLWALLCLGKTLQPCTKLNLQKNQTDMWLNGWLEKNGGFCDNLYAERTNDGREKDNATRKSHRYTDWFGHFAL
jgi:hypothetical protein